MLIYPPSSFSCRPVGATNSRSLTYKYFPLRVSKYLFLSFPRVGGGGRWEVECTRRRSKGFAWGFEEESQSKEKTLPFISFKQPKSTFCDAPVPEIWSLMAVFSLVKWKTHSWRRKLFRNDYFSYKFSFSHKHTINFNEKVFLSFILYSNFPIHLFSIYPQQDNKSYCTNSSFGYKVINHNCKFTINRKNYNQLGRDGLSSLLAFPVLFLCMKTLSAGSAMRCDGGSCARRAGNLRNLCISLA